MASRFAIVASPSVFSCTTFASVSKASFMASRFAIVASPSAFSSRNLLLLLLLLLLAAVRPLMARFAASRLEPPALKDDAV
jgi:hypothetical protein